MSVQDAVDCELKLLQQENAALNEQLKLLVQTEQRLARAQILGDRRLARIQAISEFALESFRFDEPQPVLEAAVDVLRANFNLDRFVVGLRDPKLGRLRAWSDHDTGTAADVDDTVLRWLEEQAGVTLTRSTEQLGEPLSRLAGTELADASRFAVVSIPVRGVDGRLAGFILALRSTTLRRSFHKDSIREEHRPFLQLLHSHVERAIQSARLKAALLSRGHELELANRQLRSSLDRLESTQQLLLQAKKMEAIGRLAGGVAHDFNNLLTVILGHTEMMAGRVTSEAPESRDLERVRDAAVRAARLTGQLLAFSRKQKQRLELVELNQLVGELVEMLGRLIPEHTTLMLEPAAGGARILADRAQIEQVIMNLVLNARDAMPRGGTIRIGVRRKLRDAETPPELAGAKEIVRLTVADTGGGMDAETRARVFEPFFTTKELGRGTGMGLATVYGLVRQNQGQIAVSSEPGRGSCFSVCFPVAKHGTEPVQGQMLRVRPRVERRATILVVEDEPGIRSILREALDLRGFDVLEASNGAEALAVVGDELESIDLMLCDVVMPELGGPELVRRLRRRHPAIRVLFMSGYSFESLDEPELADTPYIQKPFTPSELIARVSDLLPEK